MARIAYGRRGMVVTDHPYASMIGSRMLQEGGNAFDACLAASAMLGVTFPYMSGIGGDAFLIAKTRQGVIVLSSSGRSAEQLDDMMLARLYGEGIPERGPYTITVPGLVEAWRRLAERFCTMPVAKLLEPSREIASKGFPVSRMLQEQTRRCYRELSHYEDWLNLYGHLREGTVLRQAGIASILDEMMRNGLEDFYKGSIAKRLVAELHERGCPLTVSDFEAHEAEWVEPISIGFGGYRIYEMPPNTQGITTLQMLRLYELAGCRQMTPANGNWLQALLKICTIAYQDRDRYVSDPSKYRAPIQMMLSDSYLRSRLSAVTKDLHFRISPGDTTFLTAADNQDNVVALVQSVYHSFGSGIVAGGVVWNNRCLGFDVRAESPNRLEPGKKPKHTLSAMIAEREDQALCIGCGSAGDLRPQLHALTAAHIICHGRAMEDAIYLPRRLVTLPIPSTSEPTRLHFICEGEKKEQPNSEAGMVTTPFPSADMGIVNAIEVRESYLKGVADPRGEGVALALP